VRHGDVDVDDHVDHDRRSVESPPLEAPHAPGAPDQSASWRLPIQATPSERTPPEAPTRSVSGDGAHTPDAARAGGESAPASESASEPRPTRTAPITADPAPLGLAAFALTTFVLSLFNSGLLPEAGEPVVFGLAFAYGGLAQLLAGMWEFRTGNTFGATAFTSYGAFWISFALLEVFFADRIPEAELAVYMGWTLIAWAIFTTYMYVASFKVTGAVNIVFLLLAATFYLLGIGDVTGTEIVTRIGGFVGIVTALAGWYASFAIVTNATFRQKVLPVKELD
jgi:succinate-acetate transporter protein